MKKNNILPYTEAPWCDLPNQFVDRPPAPPASLPPILPARLLRLLGATALAAAVFLFPVPSWAAGGRGIITGRVTNATTGAFLNSARVSVDGTSLQARTGQDGIYTIKDVPAGRTKINIIYSGMEPATYTVHVADGQATVRNTRLVPIGMASRPGTENEVVELEDFVIESQKEFDAQLIAVSEERFSTAMKNVVAADQFGDNVDGNLGEFVKFLPGVLVDYGVGAYGNGADAGAVGIRGFGAEQTAIMVDGVEISGSTPGSLTRAVGLDMISVNNASRIEVSKIATPDMPDGAVGGTINLVTRTAFEYPKPQFSWRTYLSFNSDNLSADHFFKKTPGPTNRETYKALPGFDFSYVRPINDKLGFTINGQFSQQYNENHTAKAQWDYDRGDRHPVTGEYNDVTNPFLKRISVTDSPRLATRSSLGAKVDWRPTEGQRLTVNFSRSEFGGTDSSRRIQVSPDRADDWGSNGDGSGFVHSQENRGKTDMNVDFLDREGFTNNAYIKWALERGPWKIDATASTSRSRSALESAKNGHFSVIELSSTGVGRMYLDDIVDGIPQSIRLFDRNGDPYNLYDIQNYRVNDLEAADEGGSNLLVRAGQSSQKSVKNVYKLDISRDLDFIPTDAIRLTAKTGFYRQENELVKWGRGVNYSYRYTGPVDAFDSSVYADTVYVQQDPGFGFSPMTWVDPYKIYAFYEQNPDWFNDSEDIPVNGLSMAANNYNQFVNNNKAIKEVSDSYYGMLEGKMLDGRLSFITGARWSNASRTGEGPFQDKDWELVKDPTGKVWYYQEQQDGEPLFNGDGTPRLKSLKVTDDNSNVAAYIQEAAATDGVDLSHRVIKNTLEAKQLEYKPLYRIDEKTKTDPAYSFTVAYEITPRLTARFAYGRSNGRPDYEGGQGILRRVTYNEDSDGYGGTIEVGNPNLEPWAADSFDYQLAYYTKLGGKFKVSYFTKNVENYAVTESFDIDSLALLGAYDLNEDPYYVDNGWRIVTERNGEGSSKTTGYEFEVNQNLGILGRFGQNFNVYGSYTTKKVQQTDTSAVLQTPDDTGGFGLSARFGRLSASIRATYRSEQARKFTTVDRLADITDRGSERTKIQLYYRTPAETKVDVNLNYQLSDRYAVFLSARNVTNTQTRLEIFDEAGLLPDYVNNEQIKDFGFNMQLGIRGKF